MVRRFIEKAWEIYKKNFLQIIAANILVLIIPAVLVLIGILPLLGAVIQLAPELSEQTEPEVIASAIMEAGLPNILFAALFIIIAVIFSFVLKAGLIDFYAKTIRKKAELKIIFETAKEKFLAILAANIIVAVLMGLITLIFFTPLGILAYSTELPLAIIGSVIILLVEIFFLFVNQAIVIDNEGAIGSIKKSFGFSKENYTRVFIIFMAFTIISMLLSYLTDILPSLYQLIAGFFVIIVSMFVLSPLMIISLTYFYIRKGK